MGTERTGLMVAGIVVVAGALTGCGAPEDDSAPAPGADPRLAVNATTLETALANQAKMEANGLHLLGRAWFGPTAYTELYGDASSTPVSGNMSYAAGEAVLSQHKELAPQTDVSFPAYLQRVKGNIPTPLSFAATAGAPAQDVLLFHPTPESTDGLTVQRSALVNQFCPKSDFDFLCGSQIGWFDQTVLNSWYTVDDFLPTSFSANGASSINMSLCADAGDSTLTISSGGSAGFPTSFTLDVPQGTLQWRWWRGGWTQNPFCASSFIFCLRTDDLITYNRSNVTIGAHAKTAGGTNYHFCGNEISANNYVAEGESDCSEKANCPAPVGFDGQGN